MNDQLAAGLNGHDVQQVCLRGHQITDLYHADPSSRRARCPECGAQTLTECPHCHKPIRGGTVGDPVLGGPEVASVPAHCEFCGASFPWAQYDSAGMDHLPVETPSLTRQEWPERITIIWLLHNMPIQMWLTIVGAFVAAFLGGTAVGTTNLVRELRGLPPCADHSKPRGQGLLAQTSIAAAFATAEHNHSKRLSTLLQTILEEEKAAAVAPYTYLRDRHLEAAKRLRDDLENQTRAFETTVSGLKEKLE